MRKTPHKRTRSGHAPPELSHGLITSIVAMIQVSDVESSAAFYRLLGFEIGNKVPRGLFYMYAADLVGLRNELIARGAKVGEIAYPNYLPDGEFRMKDPDGYCLMIAQSGQ